MRCFGTEGYQILAANNLNNCIDFRNKINQEETMVVCNPTDPGIICLFRVYPSEILEFLSLFFGMKIDAKRLWDWEMHHYKNLGSKELDITNQFQTKVGEAVWKVMYPKVKSKIPETYWPPFVSHTKDFYYTDNGIPVSSLKAYFLTPFADDKSNASAMKSIKVLVEYVFFDVIPDDEKKELTNSFMRIIKKQLNKK